MEFQLSCFKSWKMMLWKCCIQYASKFGKLSSGHRTAKGQFSFQSQRKAMPKNAQTTVQLYLSHTVVKQCSKFSKLGFSITWTMNFQMFKLRHVYPNVHRSTIYNSQDMEAIQMSISRWMDKKAVVHIHNGVLHSHRKEYIWISSSEMDETGADYTKWSKPERKTPIQYTNTYIWNLERW